MPRPMTCFNDVTEGNDRRVCDPFHHDDAEDGTFHETAEVVNSLAGNAGLWPASEAGGTPALPAKTATPLDDGR